MESEKRIHHGNGDQMEVAMFEKSKVTTVETIFRFKIISVATKAKVS